MQEFKLPKVFNWQLWHDKISPPYTPPYKVYTALLTQTGINAPVATVLENTIGNIWFTYNTIGEYQINSNGLFIIDKTWVVCPANTGQGDTNIVGVSDVNIIDLATSNSSNTLQDDLLSTTSIEIRVYNT